MPFPRHLLTSPHADNLALFIGSDLPASVTGLPSRAKLARELAQRKGLDDLLSSLVAPRLAEVASRAGGGDSRQTTIDFIRQAYVDAGATPMPFHHNIARLVKRLGIKTIISTAYDDLLEQACTQAQLALSKVINDESLPLVSSGHPQYFKLFGELDQPESLVVTEDDHLAFMDEAGRRGVREAVSTIFRTKTVVFLGYNLCDQNILMLLHGAARPEIARAAFAVWPGMLPADVARWRGYGIEILGEDPLQTLTESYSIQRSIAAERELGHVEMWDPAGAASAEAGRSPAYEMAMAANFDLDDLVRVCEDHLRGQHGLVGFAVPCLHDAFVEYFPERLNRSVFRRKARVGRPQKVDAKMNTVEGALRTIQRRFLADLRRSAVLFALECGEEKLLERFWQNLTKSLEKETLNHHLIVILPVTPDWELPRPVVSLPEPCFRDSHVSDWVDQVGQKFNLPPDLIDSWYRLVLDECYFEGRLVIDWVYQHLDEMIAFLERRPSVAGIQQELERRRREYVSTPG